jgi:hypothetical protein
MLAIVAVYALPYLKFNHQYVAPGGQHIGSCQPLTAGFGSKKNNVPAWFQGVCEHSLCCDAQAVVMGIQEVTTPRYVSSGCSTKGEVEVDIAHALML